MGLSFRFNQSFGPCKSLRFYPIQFGDIMDAGPSSQTGVLTSRDHISPTKGTRTRTVREYEETISELKKENFDLKLKQYMFNEAMKRKSQKDGNSTERDNIEVIVRLEFLENELQEKDKTLQDALEKVANYEIDLKELQNKNNELQAELHTLSELPAKEEYLSLLDEKEQLVKHVDFLENALTEKEEEISTMNQKLEILADTNRNLEEKTKKKSKALEGFVLKLVREKDMLPDELRNVVISATQAAKNGNKDDLCAAMKNISAILNKVMCSSVQVLRGCENKENIVSSKCLYKESSKKTGSFLPSQSESCVEQSLIQAPEQHSMCTQTDIAGCNLLNDYEITKLHKDAELSDNIDELRRDILLLLLAVEAKNNELTDVKQSLLGVQEELKKTLNATNMLDKDYYMNERNELHEKLALSCAVNEDLLRHLKNLETFMEDMLQNRFNSSNQSMSENSDFINSVSRCLNQSLKLSQELSNHLSFCEGSKLFEECESLYKNGSYTNDKSLPHLGLSHLSMLEQHSSSCPDPRSHILEDYIPFVRKSDSRMNTEYDDSQLCWRCWQQLNSPLNKSEISHQIQNNVVHKNVGYPSSESDIWSEPDRNISMQRIGISLQNSPVSSKSPRKSRLKEKRMSSRLSSNQDTSSNESQRLFKKRHGSVNRHLFAQSTQNDDLNEKNIELSKSLDDAKRLLNAEKEALEAFKELNLKLLNEMDHLKKELKHTKQKETELFERNVKLSEELTTAKRNIYKLDLNNLKEPEETDYSADLDQLTAELHATKLDLENINKKCLQYENELDQHVCKKEEYGNKLKALESIALNEKKQYLNQINELNAEKNHCELELKTAREESEIINNNLKYKQNELVSLQESINILQADKETLNAKCIELQVELNKVKESSVGLDQLTSELQKKNLVIVNKSKKCLEYENELDQQICKKKECESKLEALEIISLSEKKRYLNQINELNAEKNQCVMEREIANQKRLALELENEMLNNNLKSNNNELVSLQTLISKMKEDKETLNNKCAELQIELEKAKESSVALNQLNMELQKYKLDLENTNQKCLEYENELDQEIHKKEECEIKLKSLETTFLDDKKKYISQINEYSAERNRYVMELNAAEEKRLALEKEIESLNNNLKSSNSELVSLQKLIDQLQEAEETLTTKCTELQTELKNTKQHINNLQKKCSSYEEAFKRCNESEAYYCEKLKQLEATSLNEKTHLMDEISLLTKEREDIIQKLNYEKEYNGRLIAEKDELNKNYVESCRQISSLQLLNDELKDKEVKLIQKNEFIKIDLHSSNSECIALKEDLKHLRETLQNLEYKCLVYEKELVAAAGMKESFVECLLNINKEFSSGRQKMNEIGKAYGNENYVLGYETSEFIPVIDEDNVGMLCEILNSESKKLMQSVDMLLSLLKNVHLRYLKTSEEKRKMSIDNKQMEFQKSEIGHFKSQKDNLQRIINELQESISEKEKSIQFSAVAIQSLKEKICDSEKEIEKGNQLLNRKDNEITMLQERIFNLQTHLHKISTNKSDLHDKTSSFDQKFLDRLHDSAYSDNQLPSQPCLKAQKMCQTEEYKVSSQNADDSFTSTSSLETSKNGCCEKYWKKCHSLQTKLAFTKKHIEILEKEKNDLRNEQFQNKRDSSVERDSVGAKLADLESKLEKKRTFIIELKKDLLDTCNSLLDKEKEVEVLKQKLSECEAKYKDAISDMCDRHSIATNTVDTNIKTVRNHKWRLIQTIFDIQKKFYEKKGIHLNYFEKFKDHVNNLYSMQLTQSFSKSESMPLLGSHALTLKSDQNSKVNNLVGLELDIECLENLKIFLDRFFVPSILETDVKSAKFEEKGRKISFDRLMSQSEVDKSESTKLQQTDILNISFPDMFTTHVSLDHKDSPQEQSFSFENFASYISYHLECIQKFFTAVTKASKCQILENFDMSAKECANKVEAKSLLLKIFQEINAVNESSDKLFDFNSFLKNFDFVEAPPVPINSKKQDLSDRESLMSEETITVSRSESPFSLEDIFPTKLSCPEISKLEEKRKSMGNKATVMEPFGTKVTTIGSSCDSVCQRSHFSSPDLGIESDPNHDSSAPEQKDDDINKYQKISTEEKKNSIKTQHKSILACSESAGRWSDYKFGETLYAIGNLPHYELLKKEVRECLVAIKSVLSRTGDGLHHIGKYTSPRKALEYSTLKSIKDSCAHIEACLKAAHELIAKFRIAPCPSEKEWKFLVDENQNLSKQLSNFKVMLEKQESEFKRAIGKLEHAQVVKASMEKKISKKLVKTKKVIRQAELKLLENRCQNFPPVPKYPYDQNEQQM